MTTRFYDRAALAISSTLRKDAPGKFDRNLSTRGRRLTLLDFWTTSDQATYLPSGMREGFRPRVLDNVAPLDEADRHLLHNELLYLPSIDHNRTDR